MELELPSPVDDLPSPVDDSSIDLPDCDDGIEALASCPTQRSAVCMKKPASRECRRPWLEDLPQDDSGDDWRALVDDALDDSFFSDAAENPDRQTSANLQYIKRQRRTGLKTIRKFPGKKCKDVLKELRGSCLWLGAN